MVITLQMLNMSIGGDIYQNAPTYNSSFDPTESVVEWVVESQCGQLPAFTYSHSMDLHKGPAKTMHWQIGQIFSSESSAAGNALTKKCWFDHHSLYFPSHFFLPGNPPPEPLG